MASIGIPIALDLIKKVSGAAAPRMGTAQPPPFYGSWNQNTIGKGKKKKGNGGRPAAERKPIQRYPTDRNHIVKPQFYNKYELLFTCNKIATKIVVKDIEQKNSLFFIRSFVNYFNLCA